MVLSASLRQRWRRLPLRWRRAVLAVLALRVGLSIWAVVAGGLLPGLSPVSVPPGPGFSGWEAASSASQGWGLLGAGLERFDALWYLAIARDGYPTTAAPPAAAAFFPGAPILFGVVGRLLGGAFVLGASLVSAAASVLGLAGVHALAEDELPGQPDAPRRALLAVAVFPAAFFLLAPYTEAVFLAASTWALVWLRRGRWLPAAGAIAIAAVTRNVGFLLAIPAMVEIIRQRSEVHRTRSRLRATAALLAAPAALGAWLLVGLARWGSWAAPLETQSGWQRVLTAPWTTLLEAGRTASVAAGAYAAGYHALDLVIAVPVLAATVWLWVRAPRSLALYATAHVLVWLLFPFPGRPLMSTPRFALAVAPIFLAFAAWTHRRGAESAWAAASATLLGAMSALYVGWYYIF